MLKRDGLFIIAQKPSLSPVLVPVPVHWQHFSFLQPRATNAKTNKIKSVFSF
jgi:hypothetical protein